MGRGEEGGKKNNLLTAEHFDLLLVDPKGYIAGRFVTITGTMMVMMPGRGGVENK